MTTKPRSECYKLPEAPEKEKEEEVSASLAAAKKISMDAAVAAFHIRTGWYFHI